MSGDGIIMFAERHEYAGEGFHCGFHRFGCHGIALGDARDRLANAWPEINQAFLLRWHLGLSRQFGASNKVRQQKKEHAPERCCICGLLIFRPCHGSPTPPAFRGSDDHDFPDSFRGKI